MCATSAATHYLISAPWRSSGKTLVSIGLARAAYRQQLAVQTFKKGPDYIDPLWLAQASGVPCYNLDPWVQRTDELVDSYQRRFSADQLSLVEGTMGLHDGLQSDGSDSNAAIAKLLGLQVLLVVDCRGMHRTIAALVNGLQHFDAKVQFAGVVLNRIRSPRHASKIRSAIAEHTSLTVVGEIPEHPAVHIAEKQLGLTPAPEAGGCASLVDAIADLVTEHCDLAGLFAGAGPVQGVAPTTYYTGPVKIGIARDEAFHFYYQDDLEVFRQRGVELMEISPLRDELPQGLDGLIIGGGFPERYAAQLEKNTAFRRALKAAVEAGLPVHAECGGLMYLCRAIITDNGSHEMAGVFDASVTMQDKPVGRGYVKLRRLSDNRLLAAHEFHHSTAQFDEQARFAYAVQRGYGIDGQNDGVCRFNVQASYAHFRHTQQYPWIDEFLARCRPSI